MKNFIILSLYCLVSSSVFGMKSSKDIASQILDEEVERQSVFNLSHIQTVNSHSDPVDLAQEESLNLSVVAINPREAFLAHQEQQLALFNEQMDACEQRDARIGELEKEVAELKATLVEKEETIATQAKKIKSLTNQLKKTQGQVRKLTQELEETRQENAQLCKDFEAQKVSLQEALLREEELKARMERQQEQIRVIRAATEALQAI